MISELPRNYFGAILADPPWTFYNWSWRPWWERTDDLKASRAADRHYRTMALEQIALLPVEEIAAADCSLFLWATWPNLLDAIAVISQWGFTYKTCAFLWCKTRGRQLELFGDEIKTTMGLGYWTRANSEPCLLATRGRPKRIAADVRQVILEPRREHSRKPDCVHERIERLVAGPYLELFARERRGGWYSWGDELEKFGGDYDAVDDFEKSVDACYAAVRERKAGGGPGWPE
jgi:N6-adenosine-specific RNA methylase IME4